MQDPTVALGTEDGFVLILDTRKEGVVEKLSLNAPCMHVEISARTVTAWGVENSVVKVWDVDAFSCLGEMPLFFDVAAVGHSADAEAPFMLTFGASRPRKFNRGHASILCLAAESSTTNIKLPEIARPWRKLSRG
jgi:hypothetical protein